MDGVVSVVLAAGLGQRMLSNKPKVLHTIAEKPMVSLLLDVVEQTQSLRSYVVTGYKHELVEQEVSKRATCVWQKEQLGTGNAVSQIVPYLSDDNNCSYVVILCGDVPLLRSNTIDRLIDKTVQENLDGTVLAVDLSNPLGYGRIVEDDDGYVRCIVEEKLASDYEKNISRVNTGAYCFKKSSLLLALQSMICQKNVNEYLLTDVVDILYRRGQKVKHLVLDDPMEAMGINSREDLILADKIFQQRYKQTLIQKGVLFVAPELSYVALDVKFGTDVTVEPFVVIHRGSCIPSGAKVASFSNIFKDSKIC